MSEVDQSSARAPIAAGVFFREPNHAMLTGAPKIGVGPTIGPAGEATVEAAREAGRAVQALQGSR